jgi:flagellar biosynthesis/type III secretory pathway protein FliH
MLKPNLSMKEILEQAKEMEIAGKEMSYAEGYKEGYKRALEMVEWYIKNYIGGMVQDHIGDTNKKVDE